MELMSSTEGASSSEATRLCEEEQIILREVAYNAIESKIKYEKNLSVDVFRYPAQLQQMRASFVTLKLNNELRGCIGTLEAYQPLVKDIAHNAHAAAFSDPRFQPVLEKELENITFHISILSSAIPMTFDSEKDLLGQIKPGIDGLVLEDEQHRGTFLPAVWESLPEPAQFLQHLKQKAGLLPDYWSDTIKISRYTTESF